MTSERCSARQHLMPMRVVALWWRPPTTLAPSITSHHALVPHREPLPSAAKKPTPHPTSKKPTVKPASPTQPGAPNPNTVPNPQTGPAGSGPGPTPTVAPVGPNPSPNPASPSPAPVTPAPALQPTVSLPLWPSSLHSSTVRRASVFHHTWARLTLSALVVVIRARAAMRRCPDPTLHSPRVRGTASLQQLAQHHMQMLCRRDADVRPCNEERTADVSADFNALFGRWRSNDWRQSRAARCR